MRAGPLSGVIVGVVLAVTLGVAGGVESPARPAPGGGLLGARTVGDRNAPIIITADTLEYDHKTGVVVYRGGVQVLQGEVKVKSDTLTVSLARAATETATATSGQRVRDIVATGNVRIDHGSRWATGGRAVFDQVARTLVLVDNPVLHDGANEVAGERVVVYLDQDRSVVEGGRRRVKAVLHPDKGDDIPGGTAERPATGEAATAQAVQP